MYHLGEEGLEKNLPVPHVQGDPTAGAGWRPEAGIAAGAARAAATKVDRTATKRMLTAMELETELLKNMTRDRISIWLSRQCAW